MNATAPPAGNLYLVVGYDGSPRAIRALDAAVRLLHGRTGSIEVPAERKKGSQFRGDEGELT